jgi:hypothetical protein
LLFIVGALLRENMLFAGMDRFYLIGAGAVKRRAIAGLEKWGRMEIRSPSKLELANEHL